MSRSRVIGTRWESDVVAYLVDHGFPEAERRALHGGLDRGDIAGVPGVMLECKAERSLDLASYVDEVEIQTANAKARIGAAVVKRRNRPTSDAYVVMTLAQLVEILAEVRS